MADIPPPRRTAPSRISERVAKVQRDAPMMEEITEKCKGLLFYDHQSPATRALRARARQVFEEYCERKLGQSGLAPEEMWNADTICERTYELIMIMAACGKGRIGEKPKIGHLYQQRMGMYWWIVRFIPHLSPPSLQRWDVLTKAAIHKAALDFNLETRRYEKNNLTDAELELFFRQLKSFDTGVANWKQHYVVWVLVYMLPTRPGSFTVCKGYSKGAILPNGQLRTEDETLRWSDIQFIRLATREGIKVVITFRYLKGYRDPHTKRMVEGKRTFTLMPVRNDQHHFDLGLLLTALAFSRGLFRCSSPQQLFDGVESDIPRGPSVDSQAVFLASDQAGSLLADKPMTENVLNPQLRKMCERSGLFARNTIYSLRRSAIVEVRRQHGSETARELANHVPNSNSIYAYDHEGLADFDVLNARMGLPTISREEMREMLKQVTTSRINVADLDFTSVANQTNNEGKSLQVHLDRLASSRARADNEYLSLDRALRDHLANISDYLFLPSWLLRDINDHYEQLTRRSAVDETAKELLDTLDTLVKDRKNGLRRLQAKHKAQVKDEMLKEAQKNQQVMNQIVMQGSAHIKGIEGLDTFEGTDDGSDYEDDEAEDEEEADHGRTAPRQWEHLTDDVVLHAPEPREEDIQTEATPESRLKFLVDFISLQDKKNAGLKCLRCAYDPTVPYTKKAQTYTHWKLDAHLKGTFHSGEGKLKRAIEIDLGPDGKRTRVLECPVCEEQMPASKIVSHVKKNHGDTL